MSESTRSPMLLFAALLLAACATAAGPADPLGPAAAQTGGAAGAAEAVPIAVLPLELPERVRQLYPQLAERSVGFGVHTMLVDHLYDTGRFRLVEARAEVIDELMRIQWLGTTGAVTAESAVRHGQLLGARYVVYGEVSAFSSQKIKKKQYETRIQLQVRLVDVETSELVPARGTGAVIRKGEVFAKSDPVEFARSTVGEATDAALAEAVGELMRRFSGPPASG